MNFISLLRFAWRGLDAKLCQEISNCRFSTKFLMLQIYGQTYMYKTGAYCCCANLHSSSYVSMSVVILSIWIGFHWSSFNLPKSIKVWGLWWPWKPLPTPVERENTKSLSKLPFAEFIMVQKVLTGLLIAPDSFNKLPYKEWMCKTPTKWGISQPIAY